MRQLLFEYGAEETAEDKDDWLRRQKADACEDACTSAFYEDDRHLCPCSGAMEKSESSLDSVAVGKCASA